MDQWTPENHSQYLIKSLRPYFFLQEKLDQRINYRFGISQDEHSQSYFMQLKQLAFRVELGELLNATRFHKFWSQKEPEADDVILEEYVDGLHFILSMGIDRGIRDYTIEGVGMEHITKKDLVFVYDELFTYEWFSRNPDHYLRGIELYYHLGTLLGFSWTEITQAYTFKHLENIERQNSLY